MCVATQRSYDVDLLASAVESKNLNYFGTTSVSFAHHLFSFHSSICFSKNGYGRYGRDSCSWHAAVVMISCAAQLLKTRREAIKNKIRATGELDVLFYFILPRLFKQSFMPCSQRLMLADSHNYMNEWNTTNSEE